MAARCDSDTRIAVYVGSATEIITASTNRFVCANLGA